MELEATKYPTSFTLCQNARIYDVIPQLLEVILANGTKMLRSSHFVIWDMENSR